MGAWSRLASLFRNLRHRTAVEDDLDCELRVYLDQVTDSHVRAGMSPAEARRAAQIELGGLEQVKEEVRQTRTGHMLEEILQDLRYGLRALGRNPAFTAATVLVLALGIGANTAMFSVVYGVLLRPLPYPEAERLAVVCMRFYPRDFEFGTLSLRDFQTWREGNHAFEEPSVFSGTRLDIGGREGAPEQVRGALVTSGFFPALRLPPLIGRVFAPGEDQPSAPSLMMIGESLWRRRFAADPKVIGESVLVGGAPYTVIGVAPRTVGFPSSQTEAWINLKLVPPTRYGPWFYRGIARLKPGVTMAQAQAETNVIGQRIMRLNPNYKRLTLPLLGVRDWIIGDPRVRKALLLLIGAVGLVLLIAVVNVTNLVLARASVREREMALRLSLGASRGRLVRQLLVESLLLAVAGGVAGMAVAYAVTGLVRAWNPGDLSLMESVRPDARAFLFMLAVSALTAVLFGLFPAWHSSRADLNATLKEGGRSGTAGHARQRTRAVLVTAEIALSLMLLVGAGLLMRSLARLERMGGGFEAPPEQLLSMVISPGDRKFQDPKIGVAFYREVLRRARQAPGVMAAALSDALPPDRQGDADTFVLEGQAFEPGKLNPIVSAVTCSPGYFEGLRIPLLRGRYFTEHDTAESVPVAIISETMAQRFFPGRDPIGQRIMASGPYPGNPWREIVGLVRDVKYLGRREKQDSDAAYYVPLVADSQSYATRMYLVVRTTADAASVTAALRREIQSANPMATVAQVGTMEQAMALDVAEPRLDTALLGFFAGIALLLAAVGIYGLIAYSVAQRTQEIGIRMTLGARPGDVLRLVGRQGAGLALAGIGLGMAGALALTRLLNALLFGVSATDIDTFLLAALGLLAVVALATAIPARRAARISPMAALRYE